MADAAFQIALASELLPHISENEQNLAIIANNLSSSFMEFYQLKKALEFQEKAIKILEVELNANHPHLATSYHNLSATYLGLNNLDSAHHFSLKAVHTLRAMFPEGHPNLKKAEMNLAIIEEKMAVK